MFAFSFFLHEFICHIVNQEEKWFYESEKLKIRIPWAQQVSPAQAMDRKEENVAMIVSIFSFVELAFLHPDGQN